MPTIKTIIGLAFMLSIGALLNILGCALYSTDWLPFCVVVMYFLAPIPNLICEKCFSGDGMLDSKRGYPDVGYFLTGFILVSGFGLPLVLLHAAKIKYEAAILSLVGGVIVYATVLAYIHYFHNEEES